MENEIPTSSTAAKQLGDAQALADVYSCLYMVPNAKSFDSDGIFYNDRQIARDKFNGEVPCNSYSARFAEADLGDRSIHVSMNIGSGMEYLVQVISVGPKGTDIAEMHQGISKSVEERLKLQGEVERRDANNDITKTVMDHFLREKMYHFDHIPKARGLWDLTY
jgi:hypothetical protein